MTQFDADLLSMQQARDMAIAARQAWLQWREASQAQVDRVCEAMAMAAYRESERLGRLASEETGYGVPEHKTLKNHLCSKILWERIKDTRTVGVIRHDPENHIYDIAWPYGIVAALTPSTNPTSTVMFKTLIAVKGRNAIIVAPHPAAVQCCVETMRVMTVAAVAAGAPEGLMACMSHVSLPGTQELMRHRYTALILATGGSAMVKAAHSVGKPAYGVGPGNVPCYVDRSANVEQAARYIVASKAFDYSVICATEQAVIADRPIARELEHAMTANGAYFVDDAQARALADALFFPNGGINAEAVGKSPQQLAAMADITVPESARILVARLERTGRDEPLSREKLTTVLGWYEADGWEAGCERCIDLINFGGRGHSLVIHAEDDEVIMRFGLEKPVFRIVANTMGTLGTTGLTTGLMPSMTLGSGGVGGSITGDNIGVQHMFNVKRLAYQTHAPPAAAMQGSAGGRGALHAQPDGPRPRIPSQSEIDAAVARVLHDLKQ
ncbi:MAG: aldehyde dehydrogenase family protein [Anaerolineales bacterium]